MRKTGNPVFLVGLKRLFVQLSTMIFSGEKTDGKASDLVNEGNFVYKIVPIDLSVLWYLVLNMAQLA
jgi:hypothetical protein